ncbi:addiction module toxin, HicA family [Vibrio cholerae]|nr:addiction module toxin, HicA family [Vibrio cholerae]
MKEIKTKQAERELTKAGFAVIRTSGGHTVWASADGKQTIAVPRHRTVSPGVVRQIAKVLPSVPPDWR